MDKTLIRLNRRCARPVLPNLKTLRSPQQRNVVLHPEFVDGKYAFYTRPMVQVLLNKIASLFNTEN